MSVTDREHLSIGEVLNLLQAEFPDVTISKIRFLESQGLIDPERTPSGYRKFYDADVARLRWILLQQRDHFLPLKVIKDRLDGGVAELPFDPPLPGTEPPPDGEQEAGGAFAAPAEPTPTGPAPAAGSGGADEPSTEPDGPVGHAAAEEGRPQPGRAAGGATPRPVAGGGVGAEGRRSRAPMFNVFTAAPSARRDATPAGSSSDAGQPAGADTGGEGAGSERPSPTRDPSPAPAERVRGAGAAGPRRPAADASATGAARRPPVRRPALFEQAEREQAERARAAVAEAAATAGGAQDVAAERSRRRREATARRRAEISAVSFTAEELAAAVGLAPAAIAELERYGLIASRSVAQGRRYDEDAVVVAKLAARFASFGIEARHLRMFRVAVDRELALYDQVISPLGRNRDEGEQTRAVEVWDELDRLGADLRDALFHRRPN